MARRARNRFPVSSPFSSSLIASRPGPSVPWPSICEYPISSLAVYRDLPSYGDICMLALIVMLSLVTLCAVRENTDQSNAEFDSRPFVRFIKRRIFGTEYALVVAASLATVPVLGLIDISSPSKVENFIRAAIINYRPNVKAPRQLNASNTEVWVNGQISRILGLINSCPASINGLSNFGLSPGESSRHTVESVVRSIPLPHKPGWRFVVYTFRVIMGITARDPEGNYVLVDGKPLVFNESPVCPVPGPCAALGISPLESQLFTETLPTNTENVTFPGVEIKREIDPASATEPQERTKVSALDQEDIEKYLSGLEQASYRSALKLGNKSRMADLNAAVLSRKEAAQNQVPPSQAPSVEDESIPLSEFASRASSTRGGRGRTRGSRGRGRSGSPSATPPTAPPAYNPSDSPQEGSVARSEGSGT